MLQPTLIWIDWTPFWIVHFLTAFNLLPDCGHLLFISDRLIFSTGYSLWKFCTQQNQHLWWMKEISDNCLLFSNSILISGIHPFLQATDAVLLWYLQKYTYHPCICNNALRAWPLSSSGQILQDRNYRHIVKSSSLWEYPHHQWTVHPCSWWQSVYQALGTCKNQYFHLLPDKCWLNQWFHQSVQEVQGLCISVCTSVLESHGQ